MDKIQGTLWYPFPELYLETIGMTGLYGFWQKLTLGGFCWRLYHHDSGGAGVLINGSPVELLPDKLYILPPNCNLRTWVKGNPVQLYLHFILTSAPGCGTPLIPIPLTGTLRDLTMKLRNAMRDPKSGYIRRHLLASSLAAAAAATLPPKLFTGAVSDRRIMDICSYMRKNLSGQLDVPGLANMAGMSENSFLARFRQYTGTTPYQYLLHLRYSRAASLLELGSCTIDEICDIIGVQDRFHFSRTFKKIYGSAPASYRRSFMANNKNSG